VGSGSIFWVRGDWPFYLRTPYARAQLLIITHESWTMEVPEILNIFLHPTTVLRNRFRRLNCYFSLNSGKFKKENNFRLANPHSLHTEKHE
jgi:hypothetical protein